MYEVSGGVREVCRERDPRRQEGRPSSGHGSAGKIDFKGGDPELAFSASPKADGTYDPVSIAYPAGEKPFKGGESATITAAGDKVPGFSVSLRYPLLFVLQQPAIADGGLPLLSVSRSEDFTFTWTRGAPDADLFLQAYSTLGDKSLSLVCRFPSETGTATVPQAILSKFPNKTRVQLFSAAKVTKQAGDVAVTTYLAGEVIDPSKTAAVAVELE